MRVHARLRARMHARVRARGFLFVGVFCNEKNKMEAKWIPKSLKIGVWGVVLMVLAASWASWGASAEKWCPRGSQNAAKMAQDALKEANWSEHEAQDGAKMAL